MWEGRGNADGVQHQVLFKTEEVPCAVTGGCACGPGFVWHVHR